MSTVVGAGRTEGGAHAAIWRFPLLRGVWIVLDLNRRARPIAVRPLHKAVKVPAVASIYKTARWTPCPAQQWPNRFSANRAGPIAQPLPSRSTTARCLCADSAPSLRYINGRGGSAPEACTTPRTTQKKASCRTGSCVLTTSRLQQTARLNWRLSSHASSVASSTYCRWRSLPKTLPVFGPTSCARTPRRPSPLPLHDCESAPMLQDARCRAWRPWGLRGSKSLLLVSSFGQNTSSWDIAVAMDSGTRRPVRFLKRLWRKLRCQ